MHIKSKVLELCYMVAMEKKDKYKHGTTSNRECRIVCLWFFVFTCGAIVDLSRSFLVVEVVCELSGLLSSSSSSSSLPLFEPAYVTHKHTHTMSSSDATSG